MTVRVAEVGGISAIAVLITLLLAMPVLRAPSERVFGLELVGRHADPFTAMEQFSRPVGFGLYFQPFTDIPGALFARVVGPVAAYNLLVLLTFPLAAAAAYLLARELGLTPGSASFAALAFAFSPFHLAHAAYHPHIAQTQWIPLYLFALWRCLAAGSRTSFAVLAVSIAGVVLSNFYGGLIAATMTPVATGAFLLFDRRTGPGSRTRLATVIAALGLAGVGGLAYGSYVLHRSGVDAASYAFARDDLFRYSARWWGYFVPAAANPWLGGVAADVWNAAGVHEGLLEQQVNVGWGVVALGLVAVAAWVAPGRRAMLVAVPILATTAGAALLCSLSPERTIGSFVFTRPSAVLYDLVPMFRSYARFGVVVQLMAVMLAGLGLQVLWSMRTRVARTAGIALLALVAAEYAVWPPTLWRDVLPTAAHRWVLRQPGSMRVADCAVIGAESASVQWLSAGRIVTRPAGSEDCTEPNLADKLSATGYTHLLVRRGTAEGEWLSSRTSPDGLRLAGRFGDADVFSVSAPLAVVYTAQMFAFSPREYDARSTWRWMGAVAGWNVVNTSDRTVRAAVDVEIGSVHGHRRLNVVLDGRDAETMAIEQPMQFSRIGPLVLSPGRHELSFRAAEPPIVARDLLDNGDARPLSFRIGTWRWDVESVRP
jgi:hypothetical protein